MTEQNKIKIACDIPAEIGESPLWDDEAQLLYYLDIEGKRFFTFDPLTGTRTATPLPQKAGCLALCENGGLLFAMEDGVYDTSFQLVHPKFPVSGVRFNDGVVAPDGKFLVGTMSADGRNTGKLYRISKNDVEALFDDVTCSNGIDFSPDGKTLYFIDTPTLKVLAYDYPDFKTERLVLDVPEIFGRPDGLCVAENGDLFVALFGGGGLLHLRDGEGFAEKIDLPAKNITCPAFGGKNRDILFVTSAVCGDTAKDAGKLFALDDIAIGKCSYRYHG